MDHETFAQTFSMPLGPGGMYPRPPYAYRGAEDLWVSYEADPDAVAELLPPGVTAADEAPVCSARTRWVPFSTFGAYHEAYIMVRVLFDGEPFYYQPYVFTDNEIALGAGREIWGYGKKLATITHTAGAEQTLVTVERPVGQRIMTVAFAPERLAETGERKRLPVLSARVIPNCEPDRRPSVAELVRLDAASTVHRAADGSAKLWAGRASLTFEAQSQVDPWYRLRPTRVLGGFSGVFDFDLPHGSRVHDYLDDDELWGDLPR